MSSCCESCRKIGFIKGACRGVMDCDPDEYYCEADNDFYFCCDDEEIIKELVNEEIKDKQKELNRELTKEEVNDIEEDIRDNFGCPDYEMGYDDYY